MSEEQPAPRLMAVVPMRNESHRYLQSCLVHLRRNVGVTHIMVVDDGSDDDSFELARDTLQDLHDEEPHVYWRVEKRPGDVSSFMENEGAFRSWILQQLTWKFKPMHSIDWVLVNDADEFLSTHLSAGTAKALNGIVCGTDADCLMFGLDELWQLAPPMRRIDKAWGTQRQARVFRYRGDRTMMISPKAMASGSVPFYARESTLDVHRAIRIVHAGYADPEDRRPKYDRYTTTSGHSGPHVQSILDPDAELISVANPPDIWRGVR